MQQAFKRQLKAVTVPTRLGPTPAVPRLTKRRWNLSLTLRIRWREAVSFLLSLEVRLRNGFGCGFSTQSDHSKTDSYSRTAVPGQAPACCGEIPVAEVGDSPSDISDNLPPDSSQLSETRCLLAADRSRPPAGRFCRWRTATTVRDSPHAVTGSIPTLRERETARLKSLSEA